MTSVHHFSEYQPISGHRVLHVAALGDPASAPDSFIVELRRELGHDSMKFGLSRDETQTLALLLLEALDAGPQPAVVVVDHLPVGEVVR